MDNKKKNFEDLVTFFNSDMEIKSTLSRAMPKDEDSSERIEYSDRLFDEIKLMKFYFSKILDTFDFNDETKKVYENKIKKIEDKIAFDIYGDEYLNVAYKNSLSNMRPDFVKEVSENCVGYLDRRDLKLNELIEKSQTFNELLHVFHSYVVNNNKILQSLPVLKQKTHNYNKYTIYGIENNEIANQVFDSINVEQTRMGQTDIIALPDRVLMMVRDVGHATTLEIKKDNATKQFGVTYFIPKACNIDKINQLQGVTKLDSDADIKATTSGSFQIETNNVGECIVDFIEQIPTDNDIIGINVEEVNEDKSIVKTQSKSIWIERFKKWRDKIREIPDKAKKLIESLTNHNHDKER